MLDARASNALLSWLNNRNALVDFFPSAPQISILLEVRTAPGVSSLFGRAMFIAPCTLLCPPLRDAIGHRSSCVYGGEPWLARRGGSIPSWNAIAPASAVEIKSIRFTLAAPLSDA